MKTCTWPKKKKNSVCLHRRASNCRGSSRTGTTNAVRPQAARSTVLYRNTGAVSVCHASCIGSLPVSLAELCVGASADASVQVYVYCCTRGIITDNACAPCWSGGRSRNSRFRGLRRLSWFHIYHFCRFGLGNSFLEHSGVLFSNQATVCVSTAKLSHDDGREEHENDESDHDDWCCRELQVSDFWFVSLHDCSMWRMLSKRSTICDALFLPSREQFDHVSNFPKTSNWYSQDFSNANWLAQFYHSFGGINKCRFYIDGVECSRRCSGPIKTSFLSCYVRYIHTKWIFLLKFFQVIHS